MIMMFNNNIMMIKILSYWRAIIYEDGTALDLSIYLISTRNPRNQLSFLVSLLRAIILIIVT